MKPLVLVALNAALVALFVYLWRKKNLLSSFEGGKWYLSWLAVAVITLMDGLSSIYYAPAESYHFIGANAILFIAVTALIIRFLMTRMTEISRILERHGIRGGGVYSFSYLVLGPVVSFIAVSSIFVDYILTACISTVSAVENAHAMFGSYQTGLVDFGFQMFIVWAVALLNIVGISESARFTFGVFTAASFILLTLVASGIIDMPTAGWEAMGQSVIHVGREFRTDGFASIAHNISFIIIGVSSCILAYSGVESVIQTAGLVRNWHDVRRAYMFLGLTVGVVTPVIAALALSHPGIDLTKHEGDLITFYGRILNGPMFAIAVGALASFILTMAVNTAYVASAELIEHVGERYGFHWIVQRNQRGSLYRIHLINAALYTTVIVITAGSQRVLAEMYAVGLVASFVINTGSLLIYRYRAGTTTQGEVVVPKDVPSEKYHSSRFGTLLLFLLLLGCLIYLAYSKPFGLAMWATFTVVCLVIGIRVARKRAPEIKHLIRSDSPMEMILHLAEQDEEDLHIHFRRPTEQLAIGSSEVYISFFSPRLGLPESQGPGHFRFANERVPLIDAIKEIIELVKYEFPDRTVTFHFGWPLSSWFDRLSIGVMVYSLMQLPQQYPSYNFMIEYHTRGEPAPTS